MNDSNLPEHIAVCDVCGDHVDLRVLCEVWKHQHNGSSIKIDPSIVGTKVGPIEHIGFKEFRHVASAMIFIEASLDKEEELHDLFIQYKEQSFEKDPVMWIRDALHACAADSHAMYIRQSFTALTYHQAQTVNQVG